MYLSKLIELKSWTEFLNWLEEQNSNSNMIYNNFSNSTIGQVNQSSEKINLKSPIKQNIFDKTDKKSWLEITSWVIGIIVGVVAIYEFIIKKLIL